MEPIQADHDARLLDAAVASHRRWFSGLREANRFIDGPVDVDDLASEARSRGDVFGVWVRGRDDDLGVRLIARGFGWGWRPHWMGLELDRPPSPHPRFEVVPAEPPLAKTLPFGEEGPLPAEAIHLGVRLREKIIGEVVVLPGDGFAGIYSMGVVPKVQGRGIGLALMNAALRAAWDHDCPSVVLNSTPDGERLYARTGFRSLGWGQTWWSRPGPEPTERQIALAEAVGLGDIAGLEELAPSEAEASSPLPGGVIPLGLAALVGQAASVDFLLTRFPDLSALGCPPHGGNLLHVAVEHDRPEIVDVALRHGVDVEARDAVYGGTPQGWAEHFARSSLVERLRVG